MEGDVSVVKVVSEKQKKSLERIADSDRPDEREHAKEILNCVDRGVVPAPSAVEWFVEWLRTPEAR